MACPNEYSNVLFDNRISAIEKLILYTLMTLPALLIKGAGESYVKASTIQHHAGHMSYQELMSTLESLEGKGYLSVKVVQGSCGSMLRLVVKPSRCNP